MWIADWKPAAPLKGIMLGAVLAMGFASQGSALAPAAPGTTVITATVAPVRYVLVDSRGTIREIQSNSQMSVTPIVYKNSFHTNPVALSPDVYDQYRTLMTHINTRHTGVIYRLTDTTTKKPAVLSGWMRPCAASYQFQCSRS